MADLKVSSAADFKPVEQLLKLPSGLVVKVKDVDVASLIMSADDGEIPDWLGNQVVDMFTGKSGKPKNVPIDKKNLPGIMAMINTFVRAAVVEPIIVRSGANYEAGQINQDDLKIDDRVHIFQLILPEELKAAETFRQRVEAANLAVVQRSKGHIEQTEPVNQSQK